MNKDRSVFTASSEKSKVKFTKNTNNFNAQYNPLACTIVDFSFLRLHLSNLTVCYSNYFRQTLVAFVALPSFLKTILGIGSCDYVTILCYFIALFYTCNAFYQLPWYCGKMYGNLCFQNNEQQERLRYSYRLLQRAIFFYLFVCLLLHLARKN